MTSHAHRRLTREHPGWDGPSEVSRSLTPSTYYGRQATLAPTAVNCAASVSPRREVKDIKEYLALGLEDLEFRKHPRREQSVSATHPRPHEQAYYSHVDIAEPLNACIDPTALVSTSPSRRRTRSFSPTHADRRSASHRVHMTFTGANKMMTKRRNIESRALPTEPGMYSTRTGETFSRAAAARNERVSFVPVVVDSNSQPVRRGGPVRASRTSTPNPASTHASPAREWSPAPGYVARTVVQREEARLVLKVMPPANHLGGPRSSTFHKVYAPARSGAIAKNPPPFRPKVEQQRATNAQRRTRSHSPGTSTAIISKRGVRPWRGGGEAPAVKSTSQSQVLERQRRRREREQRLHMKRLQSPEAPVAEAPLIQEADVMALQRQSTMDTVGQDSGCLLPSPSPPYIHVATTLTLDDEIEHVEECTTDAADNSHSGDDSTICADNAVYKEVPAGLEADTPLSAAFVAFPPSPQTSYAQDDGTPGDCFLGQTLPQQEIISLSESAPLSPRRVRFDAEASPPEFALPAAMQERSVGVDSLEGITQRAESLTLDVDEVTSAADTPKVMFPRRQSDAGTPQGPPPGPPGSGLSRRRRSLEVRPLRLRSPKAQRSPARRRRASLGSELDGSRRSLPTNTSLTSMQSGSRGASGSRRRTMNSPRGSPRNSPLGSPRATLNPHGHSSMRSMRSLQSYGSLRSLRSPLSPGRSGSQLSRGYSFDESASWVPKQVNPRFQKEGTFFMDFAARFGMMEGIAPDVKPRGRRRGGSRAALFNAWEGKAVQARDEESATPVRYTKGERGEAPPVLNIGERWGDRYKAGGSNSPKPKATPDFAAFSGPSVGSKRATFQDEEREDPPPLNGTRRGSNASPNMVRAMQARRPMFVGEPDDARYRV